jgi:hypothetical protein
LDIEGDEDIQGVDYTTLPGSLDNNLDKYVPGWCFLFEMTNIISPTFFCCQKVKLFVLQKSNQQQLGAKSFKRYIYVLDSFYLFYFCVR